MFSVTTQFSRRARILDRLPSCRKASSFALSPRHSQTPRFKGAFGLPFTERRTIHPHWNPWTTLSSVSSLSPQSRRLSSHTPETNSTSRTDMYSATRRSLVTSNLYRPLWTLAPQHRPLLYPQSLVPLTRFYSSSSTTTTTNGILTTVLPRLPRRDNSMLSLTTPRVWHRPITIRTLSTNNHGKDAKDTTESSSADQVAKDSKTTAADEASSAGDSTSSRISEASKAVRQRVEQVEERLSKVLQDVVAVSAGDQLAVVAIVLLLVGLVSAPYVINQMKASNRNYDNLADTDDPVDDFTQLVSEEWDSSPDATRVSALENLLSDLVQSKALKQAAQQFVIQLVEAPEVKAALQRLLLALWKDLVEDPETIKQVINLLAVAIADEQVKQAALKLVLDLVAEPEVQASLVEAVRKLGVDPEVQKTLEVLLSSTAHNTLNDAEVLDHSMEFATDVLGDDVVQQTAGEALRNTVRHAFKPAATVGLTATGVGLMLFGILALGYARSSEYEAKLLDTAARSLQTNAAYGLQRLITWPARVLGGGLTWVQQGIVRAWTALLNAAAQHTGRLGQWIVQGVARTGASLGSAMGQSWQSLCGSTWSAARSVWSAGMQSVFGLLQGSLRSIHRAWANTNASLLQWSWNVVLWGHQLSWRVFVWIPRAICQSAEWRSLQDVWERLTSQVTGWLQ